MTDPTSIDTESARSAAAILRFYRDAGVDEVILDTPVDRFMIESSKAAAAPLPAAERSPAPGADTLAALARTIAAHEGCALQAMARHTVFADGVPGAPVMLIGEAPGAEEDRLGKPFVGPAGQLLDRMLASIGLSRAVNVYISNILPWRPPANRTPNDSEIAQCLPFIERHIELARPQVIVALGGISAKALLGVPTGITRLRGRFGVWRPDGEAIPLLPMFHPAFLLRQPLAKREAWQDLLTLRAMLDRLAS